MTLPAQPSLLQPGQGFAPYHDPDRRSYLGQALWVLCQIQATRQARTHPQSRTPSQRALPLNESACQYGHGPGGAESFSGKGSLLKTSPPHPVTTKRRGSRETTKTSTAAHVAVECRLVGDLKIKPFTRSCDFTAHLCTGINHDFISYL